MRACARTWQVVIRQSISVVSREESYLVPLIGPRVEIRFTCVPKRLTRRLLTRQLQYWQLDPIPWAWVALLRVARLH